MITKGAKEPKLKIFAERFSELRGDKTQAEFADFIGISRPTIGFYENGERLPDALVLRNIAEKCKVSADWLLGISDVQTFNMDIKSVNEITGLSEKNIKVLNKLKECDETRKLFVFPEQDELFPYIDIINMIIDRINLDPDFIEQIRNCLYYVMDPCRTDLTDYFSASMDLEDAMYESYPDAMDFIVGKKGVILSGAQAVGYFCENLRNSAGKFFNDMVKSRSNVESERTFTEPINVKLGRSLKSECNNYIIYMKDCMCREKILKLYRDIFAAIKNNSIGNERVESYDNFKTECRQYKSDVKAGIKTEDEFITWLEEVKEKKVL